MSQPRSRGPHEGRAHDHHHDDLTNRSVPLPHRRVGEPLRPTRREVLGQ
jgi:hypothetical protein